MAGEVAVIKLTDAGTINLSGTLVSDVSGNGNLNVKSSSALVDGNVSGSNLTFEADHSLSKLVSGTIGDLASLNVNKGTLTYDKQTGKIGNLNVAAVWILAQIRLMPRMLTSKIIPTWLCAWRLLTITAKSMRITSQSVKIPQ